MDNEKMIMDNEKMIAEIQVKYAAYEMNHISANEMMELVEYIPRLLDALQSAEARAKVAEARAAEAYNIGFKMGHKNNEYREGLWDAERDRLQAELDSVKTQLSYATEAADAFRESYNRLSDGKCGVYRDRNECKCNRLQAELETTKNNLKGMDAAYQAAERECRKQKADRDRLQAELEELKDTYDHERENHLQTIGWHAEACVDAADWQERCEAAESRYNTLERAVMSLGCAACRSCISRPKYSDEKPCIDCKHNEYHGNSRKSNYWQFDEKAWRKDND